MRARDHAPAASYLLAVTGFLSLVPATGAIALPLMASAGLLLWARLERRTRARLPRPVARAADLLVVTAVLGLAAAFFATRAASLVLLVQVLLFAQLTRAVRRKTPRDLAVLHGTALAQVAATAFITRDALFLPILLAAIVLGVMASLALPAPPVSSRGDLRVFVARPRGAAGLRARVGTVGLPATLALAVLLVGTTLFVVLPRGARFRGAAEPESPVRDVIDPTDYSRDREDEEERITGFSGSVRLGEVGRIKRVPREAFRVKLERLGRPTNLFPRLLYFRGAVLDTFDGTTWSRSPGQEGAGRIRNESGRGPIAIHPEIARERAGARLVTQEFRMKATTSRMLLALGTVTSLELSERMPFVYGLGGDSFAAPRRHAEGFVYRVTSLVPNDPDKPPLEEELGPARAAVHLTLFPGSERIAALARSIAGDGSPLAKAARIQRHLFERCEYTLLFRDEPSGNPVDDFLFETRAGHCEYFATAQALMLRAVGVPTRVVAGYRGGLSLEDEGSYFVRMSDAHAWVEAHVEGRGWVRLDPTPPDDSAVSVDPSRVPGSVAPEPPADLADRLVSLIRDYGSEDRSEVLSALGRGVAFLAREGFGLGREERPYPPPGLILVVAVGALLVSSRLLSLVRFRRRRRERAGEPRPRKPPPEAPFYRQALRALARDGTVRRPESTPREFLGLVLAARGERAAPFREITSAFEGVRYGEAELSPAEEAAALALVRSLEEGLAAGQR